MPNLNLLSLRNIYLSLHLNDKVSAPKYLPKFKNLGNRYFGYPFSANLNFRECSMADLFYSALTIGIRIYMQGKHSMSIESASKSAL